MKTKPIDEVRLKAVVDYTWASENSPSSLDREMARRLLEVESELVALSEENECLRHADQVLRDFKRTNTRLRGTVAMIRNHAEALEREFDQDTPMRNYVLAVTDALDHEGED